MNTGRIAAMLSLSFWCSLTLLCATSHGNDQIWKSHNHGTFQNPSARIRPRFRYWLPDPSVDHETVMRDIESAGFIGAGGVEFLPFYNYGYEGPPGSNWFKYGFGTPAFVQMFRDALIAHQRNNMVMDFSIGPNQGQGVPAEADDEGLQWDLAPFSETVPENGVFNGTIPGWGTGELVALVTGVVLSQQNISRSLPSVFADNNASWSRVIIQEGSLVDLTSNVSNPTGHANLSFRALGLDQSRRIFSFYQRKTYYKNLKFQSHEDDSIFSNGSFAVDHFSPRGAETIIEFWEKHILVNDIPELLKSAGNYAWEDSVELQSNITWTPSLPSQFKERYGYSIKRFLPLIMFENNNLGLQPTAPGPVECILNTLDQGIGVRNDYRKIINEGYNGYLRALTDWANTRLGLPFSAQPAYNLPLDMAASIPHVDVSECESLGFHDQIDAYRQFCGPAHLAGQRVISNEVGAVFFKSYSYTIPELLFSVNRAVAGGVNQFILHGQSYTGNYYETTWPGYTAFGYAVSESYSEKQPVWEHGCSEALDYIARLQFVHQRGVPRIDAAFFTRQSATDPLLPRLYQPEDLEKNGWTYDYVSPDNFAFPNGHEDEEALAIQNLGWQAVVIESTQSFTADDLVKLEGFASRGLPVIFHGGLPEQYPTTENYSQKNFSKVLSELKDMDNVYQVGYGTVAKQLSELSIRRRVAINTTGSWYSTLREDPENGASSIFILNDSEEGFGNITVNFPIRTPFFLDLWTGENTPVAHYIVHDDNSMTIPLSLAANQTVVLELDQARDSDPRFYFTSLPEEVLGYESIGPSSIILHVGSSEKSVQATLSNAEVVSLNGTGLPSAYYLTKWTLVVEHWEKPQNMSDASVVAEKHNTTHYLDSLIPWSDIDSIANTSGVGFYSTKFYWPYGKFEDPGTGAYISFSHILHAVEMFINGARVPPLDCRNARHDISRYLKHGDNEVLAVVPSTMWNYLCSIWTEIMNGGEPKLVDAFIDAGVATLGKTPNGLIGDVVITPFRHQIVQTRP